MIDNPKDRTENTCYAEGLHKMRKGESYSRRPRAFDSLPPKAAASFIMHLAGYSTRTISKLLKISKSSASLYIAKGYVNYPHLKKL